MKKPPIADFAHRLTVCSMDDVIVSGGVMTLERVGVYDGWAAIVPKKGSMFSRSGGAIKESRDKPNHEIYMNYRADLDISSAAWLFERREIAAPRWFKVLDVIEDSANDVTCFACRLVERSDLATPPSVAPDAAPSMFEPQHAPAWMQK